MRSQAPDIYRVCRAMLSPEAWVRIQKENAQLRSSQSFAHVLENLKTALGIPEYLPDLARLEYARYDVSSAPALAKGDVDVVSLNPTLVLHRSDWQLASLFSASPGHVPPEPERREQWILLWRDPRTGETRLREAQADELLAIKIVIEEISLEQASVEAGLDVDVVRRSIGRAVANGLLIGPSSRLKRSPRRVVSAVRENGYSEEPGASVFTVQWHLTNACDLKCRHCYTDEDPSVLNYDQLEPIIDDLTEFCRAKRVPGRIIFTGGNPFLHPDFLTLYEKAVALGFDPAILGNPVSREDMERLVAIKSPAYFQLSLEGLEEHNDAIRGAGTFRRVMKFVDTLRDLQIRSGIMCTATKENLEQILQLGELVRGRIDGLTFCRLSQIGRGEDLASPERRDFEAFLEAYVEAAKHNSTLRFKDSLLNIVLQKNGRSLFGGCTGYGCGAAYNFVAILPNGEVHACRKFPSVIGSVLQQSLVDLYDSPVAGRYREGSQACRGCDLRHVCGGCMARIYSCGLNVYTDRDPDCFL